jgi:hypothetical protein
VTAAQQGRLVKAFRRLVQACHQACRRILKACHPEARALRGPKDLCTCRQRRCSPRVTRDPQNASLRMTTLIVQPCHQACHPEARALRGPKDLCTCRQCRCSPVTRDPQNASLKMTTLIVQPCHQACHPEAAPFAGRRTCAVAGSVDRPRQITQVLRDAQNAFLRMTTLGSSDYA